MEDKLKLRGIFSLKVFKSGELVEHYVDDNLIVNLGRDNLAVFMTATTNQATRRVGKIGLGTNGTPPALTDTALTGLFIKTINAATIPSTGVVQYDWSLELSENNGMTIQEFGLYTMQTTPVLFARKTRTPIVKDNTIRLEGSWQILF